MACSKTKTKVQTSGTVSLTQGETVRLEVADKAIEICRLKTENASLTFRLAQAEAEIGALKANLSKMHAASLYRAQLEACMSSEKQAVQDQKLLAKELGERYGIDWSKATYSPETGEVKLGGESET